MRGVNRHWTGIPSLSGSRQTPRFMLQNQEKLWPDEPLCSYSDFAFQLKTNFDWKEKFWKMLQNIISYIHCKYHTKTNHAIVAFILLWRKNILKIAESYDEMSLSSKYIIIHFCITGTFAHYCTCNWEAKWRNDKLNLTLTDYSLNLV